MFEDNYMLKKSPSGSLCPYYYMGGELHPLHYGSYHDSKKSLFEIIDAEEAFILKSSGKNNRNIWIDLYETNIDDELIDKLISHFIAIKHKTHRLCLVGCNYKIIKKIKSALKKKDIDIYNYIQFFDDPEMAKQWLIGKIHE